jgi:hypothetical protein
MPTGPSIAEVAKAAAVWSALALVASSGCKKEGAPAEERPAGERVLEMIAAEPKVAAYIEALQAIQAASERPELTALTPRPKALEHTHWVYEGYLPGKNSSWPPPTGSCVPLPSLRDLLTAAATKQPPKIAQDWQVNGYARDIKELAELTHVFVCRQSKAVRGTMDGQHLFRGGVFDGECRAYDPWTKKYLGGFTLSASIGETVGKVKGSGRQQERLDWTMNRAIADKARRQAVGTGTGGEGNRRLEFSCIWPDQ